MARTNALLTTTDDIRHNFYERVFWGGQITGNNEAPQGSPFGPVAPPGPTAEEPAAALDGEVLGPEPSAPSPASSPALEGQIIEGGGTVHDHADLYGSIWGDGSAPQIEAPEIEAPALAPPDQGDDLTPG